MGSRPWPRPPSSRFKVGGDIWEGRAKDLKSERGANPLNSETQETKQNKKGGSGREKGNGWAGAPFVGETKTRSFRALVVDEGDSNVPPAAEVGARASRGRAEVGG